jgi:N-acyl-D-amino-acid deacylase
MKRLHAALFLTAVTAAGAAGQPPAAGLLIRNGIVVDGTGAAPRAVDVRIAGGRISAMAPSLPPRDGERVIDASGRIVAPGFIDTHSHADRGLEEMPDAASQVRQGITTAIVGQDGGSELPVSALFERIARIRPAINFGTAVGHGAVRGVVMGGDFKRAATPAEIETMKALVDRGMRDGALGLSSGLEYDPGFYADPAELVELARVAAAHGGYYTSHVRDEENEVFAAWKEAIDVGRQAGLPVLISHAKLASKPVWGRAGEALKLLEDANQSGVRVRADWYPYPFWQSSMYVLIPDRDFENRRKWDVGLAEIGGAQNVLVTSYRPNPAWNGKTVAEISDETGKDPVTTIVEMMRASGNSVGIIGTSMDEPDLTRIAAHPLVFVCSDGTLAGRHPRGYGAFPRVLATYVREQKALDLPGAIHKMTGGPAAYLGLTDRGILAVGRAADIVVFDAATNQDRGTKSDPSRPPVGVHYVIVNGEVVLDNGTITDARPGAPVQGSRRTQGTRLKAQGSRRNASLILSLSLEP